MQEGDAVDVADAFAPVDQEDPQQMRHRAVRVADDPLIVGVDGKNDGLCVGNWGDLAMDLQIANSRP